MKYIDTIGPMTSVIKEVDTPVCADHQLLIRLKYVGVCHSEHVDWSIGSPGRLYGHEPMGIVEEVGSAVTGFSVGDRVSGLWSSGIEGVGGMAEYVAIDPSDAGNLILKVPDNIRDVDGILEPLSCLMSAVSKARISMPGTEVLLIGAGYMGCGAISLLKLRGAFVTAVDSRPLCLEDALRYGADAVYTVDEIKDLYLNPDGSFKSGFSGFPVVMEWAETSDALNLAIDLTAFCGQLCVGAYHTGGPRLIDMQQLNVKAIECLSTHPRERDLSVQGAVQAYKLLEKERWHFKHVPTKIYPMSQFDLAHEELDQKYGHYMKAVIDMTRLDGDAVIV